MPIETVDFTDRAAELFLEWQALDEDGRDRLPGQSASPKQPIPFTVNDDWTVELGNWSGGTWGASAESLPALLDAILATAQMVDYDEEDAEEFSRPVFVGDPANLVTAFERLKREAEDPA